jgi:hypothetical protein
MESDLNNKRIGGRGARATAFAAGAAMCTIALAGTSVASAATEGAAARRPVNTPAVPPASAASMLSGLGGMPDLGGVTGLAGMSGLRGMTGPAGPGGTAGPAGASGLTGPASANGLGDAPGRAGLPAVPGSQSVTRNLSGTSALTKGSLPAAAGADHAVSRAAHSANRVARIGRVAHINRARSAAPKAMPARTKFANALRGLMGGQAGQLMPGLTSAASAVPR